MHLLVLFGLLALASWVFPKGIKYLLLAPLLGLAFGGFVWGVTAMILPALITLHAFATFVVAGVVVSEAAAIAL